MKHIPALGLNKTSDYGTSRDCILTFLILFIPMILVSVLLRYYNRGLFFCSLFFSGWFAWTFLEYMAHRFLMHHPKKEIKLIDFNHAHHHTHPTEIKISMTMRFILLLSFATLIIISLIINDFFTLIAGFLCGFPIYAFMHFLLHQKYGQKFLGKMMQYHIYHHCKYPDKCFGISVTWWDELFGTIPPTKSDISTKIIDFYFGNNHSESVPYIKNTLLLFLFISLQFYSLVQKNLSIMM